MTTGVALSAGLIERLAESLADAGLPEFGSFGPGPSDAEVDAAAAAKGLVLPDEARLWWTWGSSGPGVRATVSPNVEFIGIGDACVLYDEMLEIADESEEYEVGGSERIWPRRIFPVSENAKLACECRPERTALAAMWFTDPHYARRPRRGAAPSTERTSDRAANAVAYVRRARSATIGTDQRRRCSATAPDVPVSRLHGVLRDVRRRSSASGHVLRPEIPRACAGRRLVVPAWAQPQSVGADL